MRETNEDDDMNANVQYQDKFEYIKPSLILQVWMKTQVHSYDFFALIVEIGSALGRLNILLSS